MTTKNWNTKLLSGIVLLLASIFYAGSSFAEETNDEVAKNEVTKDPSEDLCAPGFQILSKETINLLLKSEIKPDDVKTYEEQIKACQAKAQALSPDKRTEFISEVESNLKLVEEMIAEIGTDIMIEAVKRPPDTEKINAKKDKAAWLKKMRSSLRLLRTYLSTKLPVDRGWGKDFTLGFYLGFEGTTVSGLKGKGTARAGVMIYNQAFGELKKESDWGLHVFGNVLMTNSAEESNQEEATGDAIDSAVEVDVNFFLPRAIKQQSVGLLTFGPIITGATKKISNVDEFTKRYQGGVRLAHSPEAYFDVMYGKTEGLKGKRIELRGQVPVSQAFNGNILIGGALNMSEGGEDANTDTVRAYVVYRVSFDDIFQVN